MIVYRRFPKKALKDSYTPNVLKIQTLLMAMSFPLCLLAAFIPDFLRLALLLWCIIMISTLPFSIKTYKKDKTAGVLSPGIILLRSLVFAAGSLLGLARDFISPSA